MSIAETEWKIAQKKLAEIERNLIRITGVETDYVTNVEILARERGEHAAQVKELRDALEGLRNELPDECSCHESYTSREKNLGYRFKDPNCLYCEFDDEIKAADAVLARTDSAPSEQTAEKSAKP